MESPIPVVETRLFALHPLDPPSSRKWSGAANMSHAWHGIVATHSLAWVEQIDAVAGRGNYTSLAFDGSGNLHVAYTDDNHGDLFHARKNSSLGWTAEIVDIDRAGEFVSLEISVDGTCHLAYLSRTTEDLHYAFGLPIPTDVDENALRAGEQMITDVRVGSESVHIDYRIAQQSDVRLVVMDVRGRVVWTAQNGGLSAGSHSTEWMRLTSRGTSVSRGAYFVRLSSPSGAVARKFIIAR